MVEHLISSTVLPIAIGESFTYYKAIPEAFEKLDASGLEFTFLPEWNPKQPPLGKTAADWENCAKPTVDDLVSTVSRINTPIVHLNRDVGDMLCSENDEIVERGLDVLKDNLETAERLDSKIAVMHLWDTRAEYLDLEELWRKVDSITKDHEQISIAVENVPISAEGFDVKTAWNKLEDTMDDRHGFTLDLNWCSFYDNFDELIVYRDKIKNVHLQGYVSRDNDEVTMKPKTGDLDILKALKEFCKSGYDGYITLEMNRLKGLEDYRTAVRLMKEYSKYD